MRDAAYRMGTAARVWELVDSSWPLDVSDADEDILRVEHRGQLIGYLLTPGPAQEMAAAADAGYALADDLHAAAGLLIAAQRLGVPATEAVRALLPEDQPLSVRPDALARLLEDAATRGSTEPLLNIPSVDQAQLLWDLARVVEAGLAPGSVLARSVRRLSFAVENLIAELAVTRALARDAADGSR